MPVTAEDIRLLEAMVKKLGREVPTPLLRRLKPSVRVQMLKRLLREEVRRTVGKKYIEGEVAKTFKLPVAEELRSYRKKLLGGQVPGSLPLKPGIMKEAPTWAGRIAGAEEKLLQRAIPELPPVREYSQALRTALTGRETAAGPVTRYRIHPATGKPTLEVLHPTEQIPMADWLARVRQTKVAAGRRLAERAKREAARGRAVREVEARGVPIKAQASDLWKKLYHTEGFNPHEWKVLAQRQGGSSGRQLFVNVFRKWSGPAGGEFYLKKLERSKPLIAKAFKQALKIGGLAAIGGMLVKPKEAEAGKIPKGFVRSARLWGADLRAWIEPKKQMMYVVDSHIPSVIMNRWKKQVRMGRLTLEELQNKAWDFMASMRKQGLIRKHGVGYYELPSLTDEGLKAVDRDLTSARSLPDFITIADDRKVKSVQVPLAKWEAAGYSIKKALKQIGFLGAVTALVGAPDEAEAGGRKWPDSYWLQEAAEVTKGWLNPAKKVIVPLAEDQHHFKYLPKKYLAKHPELRWPSNKKMTVENMMRFAKSLFDKGWIRIREDGYEVGDLSSRTLKAIDTDLSASLASQGIKLSGMSPEHMGEIYIDVLEKRAKKLVHRYIRVPLAKWEAAGYNLEKTLKRMGVLGVIGATTLIATDEAEGAPLSPRIKRLFKEAVQRSKLGKVIYRITANPMKEFSGTIRKSIFTTFEPYGMYFALDLETLPNLLDPLEFGVDSKWGVYKRLERLSSSGRNKSYKIVRGALESDRVLVAPTHEEWYDVVKKAAKELKTLAAKRVLKIIPETGQPPMYSSWQLSLEQEEQFIEDFTKWLKKKYDAVLFPDILQEDVMQLAVLNPDKVTIAYKNRIKLARAMAAGAAVETERAPLSPEVKKLFKEALQRSYFKKPVYRATIDATGTLFGKPSKTTYSAVEPQGMYFALDLKTLLPLINPAEFGSEASPWKLYKDLKLVSEDIEQHARPYEVIRGALETDKVLEVPTLKEWYDVVRTAARELKTPEAKIMLKPGMLDPGAMLYSGQDITPEQEQRFAKDFTKWLRKRYDAVIFPDVQNKDISQLAVLNPEKITLAYKNRIRIAKAIAAATIGTAALLTPKEGEAAEPLRLRRVRPEEQKFLSLKRVPTREEAPQPNVPTLALTAQPSKESPLTKLPYGVRKGLSVAAEYATGIAKGMTWPIGRFTHPFLDELTQAARQNLGVDSRWVQNVSEFLGSWWPIDKMVQVAAWMRGALKLGSGVAARAGSMAAVGGAAAVGSGSEAPGTEAALWGGLEGVGPTLGKLRALKGVEKRTQLFKRLMTWVGEKAEKVRWGPKLEGALGGRNLRELFEPALYRLPWITQRQFKKFYTDLGATEREIGQLMGEITSPMTKAERRVAYDFLTAGSKKEARLALRGLEPSRKALVIRNSMKLRRAFMKWGREATKTGWRAENTMVPLLKEATFKANLREYLPRYYTKIRQADPRLANRLEHYLNTPMSVRGRSKIYKSLSLDLERFMKRKDLSPAMLEDLGLIKDIAYVGQRGLMQVSRDVMMSKFFESLRRAGKTMSPKRMNALLREGAVNRQDFVKLGRGVELGALRGQYVPRDVALELGQFIKRDELYQTVFGRMMNWWKAGKTIFNPPAQFRNFMSNSVLNHLGGLPLWRVDIYNKARKSYLSKDAMFKLAVKHGALGGVWYGNEVRQISNAFRGSNIVRAATLVEKIAGRVYQGNEEYFKLAKFIHNIEKGLSPGAAAEDAVKWTFNYNEITPFIGKVRGSIMPFVTFTYKALPRIAESVVVAPWRLGSLMLATGAAGYAAANHLGMSADEADELMTMMPDYIKRGSFMMLPFRDEKGRLQWLDLTYILPWGDVAEIGDRRWLFFFQNPLLQLYADLRSGRDFADRPIWHKWEEPQVKVLKSMRHVANMMMPGVWYQLLRAREAGILPADFGSKLLGKAHPEAPWAPTKGQWLAQQFGLKTYARTPKQLKQADVGRKMVLERDILYEMSRQARPGGRREELPAMRRALREVYH